MTSKNKKSTFEKVIVIFSRIALAVLLMVLVYSCAGVPGLKEESIATFIKVPFVRVLLEENTSDLVLSSDASFAVECLTQGQQTVYYSSQPVKIVNDGMLVTVLDRRGEIIQQGMDEVNIIPRGQGNRLRVNNNRYRGIMKVLPHGQNLRLINVIYMEDYLKGVVPPEIGDRADDEFEAVKAQAVASRTYAMAHLQQYGKEPYDMKSSIIDQVYGGVEVENKLVSKAIESTSGYVVMYNDAFINAYYHSTCGGMTDDIADVWDRKGEGYLKPVTDDDACKWSKYFRWEEVFTEAQLRNRLEQYLSSERGRDIKIGRIISVAVEGRTAGGRVQKLVVHTENDFYRFYKDRIRWAVRRTSNPDLILPSSNFDVENLYDRDNNLTKVIFRGKGYGHGVGMCQCGAIGLARRGWIFDKILEHYYSDVEVKKIY